ncbi:MAG: tocopherol cyclase family protein [Candidatus Izemoplasma sp.]|nr:tocopherol cyclase family protein [Candidatus Izemoplasma sp.]
MSLFSYQSLKDSNYFEGWYVRIIDPVIELNMAVIFGITKESTNPHAFIQIAKAGQKKGIYRAFDLSLFYYHETLETVTIGNNELSLKHLLLDIDDIKCNLSFEDVSLQTKSSMGFFKKMPLECYQELLYPNGKGIGKIEMADEKHSINANIYLEKTYGHKFPQKWIWCQSSHAESSNATISLSVGKVPFKGLTINGFFLHLDLPDKGYHFSSYNLSKFLYESHKGQITLTVLKPFYKVIIKTSLDAPIKLVGPTDGGNMNLEVFESLTSHAKVTLYKRKKIIFEDTFTYVGLENTMD